MVFSVVTADMACDDTLSFHECELTILRHAVDVNERAQKAIKTQSPDILRMVALLEGFLQRKKLVCYGGTAINNILPPAVQFYDREVEIPDYDFYSPDPLQDTKTLADLYHQEGYESVEAKAGVHHGTFKVFVSFIPIADITYLPPVLFRTIQKDAVKKDGIYYAPPNFLRMNMYIELSRPLGDVSRWEKVLKRLTLLNAHYPMALPNADCVSALVRPLEDRQVDTADIYDGVKTTLIDHGVVFFGGFASTVYAKYMKSYARRAVNKLPDFDVIAEDPDRVADAVVATLTAKGIRDVKRVAHDAIGDIVPHHCEVLVGKDTVLFLYAPIGCHNYNTVKQGGKEVHIATIDTILAFYLAFYYADRAYYQRERIMCMAKFLFDVEEANRLTQRGVLKRFTSTCLGKQAGLEDIRAEKARKFEELKHDRASDVYQWWFLKYNPAEKKRKVQKEQKDPAKRPKKTGRKTRRHPHKTTLKRQRLPPFGRLPTVGEYIEHLSGNNALQEILAAEKRQRRGTK